MILPMQCDMTFGVRRPNLFPIIRILIPILTKIVQGVSLCKLCAFSLHTNHQNTDDFPNDYNVNPEFNDTSHHQTIPERSLTRSLRFPDAFHGSVCGAR